MRTSTLIVALVVIFVPWAAAQSAGAAPLSASDHVLYAHHASAPADTSEKNGWMNTLKDDGNDTAMGPSGSCSPATSGTDSVDQQALTATGTAINRTYTFNLTPPGSGSILLDHTQNVTASIYFGSSNCYGKVDLLFELISGKTKVANGTTKGLWYDSDAGQYPVANISVKPNVNATNLDGLQWRIQVTGKTAGSGFLGTSSSKGPTQLILPITGTGPTILPPSIYGNLTGAANKTFRFNESTNQSYVYNWTSPGGNHLFSVFGNLTEGSVGVTITNGEQTPYDKDLAGPFSESTDLELAKGVWQITVDAMSAKGNLSMSLTPHALPPTTSATVTTTPATTTTAATTTSSEAAATTTTSASKGTPSPVWAVFVGAAVAGLMVRRRN